MRLLIGIILILLALVMGAAEVYGAWVVLVSVGVLAAFGAVIGGLIAYDARFSGRSAARFANRQFAGPDGTTLHAYLAQPSGAGPYSAVLLIPEWWGLNEDIVSKAQMLAVEGYVALAVDAWRGASTRFILRALWLVLTIPLRQVRSDLDAALTYFTHLHNVDADRVAALGFCYGGRQALHLGARHPQLAATVLFYGRPVTNSPELALLRCGGPVLGIFGDRDVIIPPKDVMSLERKLNDMSIKHKIRIYPHVGHGFANRTEDISTPGRARDAWEETLRFFEKNLKDQPTIKAS